MVPKLERVSEKGDQEMGVCVGPVEGLLRDKACAAAEDVSVGDCRRNVVPGATAAGS